MAGFNIPQRLITAAVWELPVGRGNPYLNGFSNILNQVIQDWTIKVITAFSKGLLAIFLFRLQNDSPSDLDPVVSKEEPT